MFLKKSLLFLAAITTVLSNPLVTIRNGRLQGSTTKTYLGRPLFSFVGVPYGKAPVGSLRFQDPQEVENWEGIKYATEEVVCAQINNFISPQETEDCLTLNVYTPHIPNDRSISTLPVLFFIFGGSFFFGNPSFRQYGPQYLLDYGIVVVTANYRLGPFGFLSTGDTVIPGNAGLKDQQLALKWVQKNIKKFGGDPDKVTVLGHSAGGAAAGYQLLNSKSRDLFRGMILESGSPLSPWALQPSPRSIAFETGILSGYTGSSESSKNLLNFLQKVPTSVIREAGIKVYGQMSELNQTLNGYLYGPVLEVPYKNAFLTQKPADPEIYKAINNIKILLGVTSGETISVASDLNEYIKLLNYFDNKTSELVPGNMGIDNNKKSLVGTKIKDIYNGNKGTLVSHNSSLLNFYYDIAFIWPHRRLIDLLKPYVDVYMYVFSYEGGLGGPDENIQFEVDLGKVGHGEDLNYLWNFSLPDYHYNPTNEDRLVQKRLLTLFTNFVKYQNPTVVKDPLLQNVRWPTIFGANNCKKQPYLDIGKDLQVKFNFRESYYQKWLNIYRTYSNNYF